MMNYIRKFITLFILIVFVACSKDESNKPIYTAENNKAPVLSIVPKSNILNADRPDDLSILISWLEAQYSFDASVAYTLQIAKAGKNFEGAQDRVMPVQQNYNVFTQKELNEFVLSLGATPNTVNQLEARLKAQVLRDDGISKDIAPLYSNIIELEVTPYSTEIPFIYVPGNYQGWNPQAAPILYSINRDNIYSGYIYFKQGDSEFKFTKTSDWSSAVGTDFFTNLTGTVIDAGKDANFKMNGKNEITVYYITADFNTKTITAEIKTDWVGDPRVNKWSVIGEAVGGWGDQNDVMLTFNENNSLWEGSVDFIKAAHYKYRANKKWDTNYGSTKDSDGDLDLKGNLKPGGKNFAISTVAKYNITLDFRNLDNLNYIVK